MGKLIREIGYKALLLIVINSIMGTGIFFLPAIGARIAGPASIISWAVLSVIAIYISMCFAELTSMFPESGGVYEFCKQAYGRFPSFIIGWTTLIASNVTIAMLMLGAIQYLLPFDIPMIKVVVSIIFIILFNIVAYRGIKISVTMLIAFAFITLGTILALIIPSLFKFNASNFDPFFIFPISATYLAIFFIAETFFGWESPTFLAGETKNGKKVVPKAIVTGTIFIALFSLLFVISSLGSVNWEVFGNSAAPLSFLAGVHYGTLGISIFTILVYLSIVGSVAGWTVTSPRLILSMAKDRLFLKQTASIHHKFNTPYKAIIFQTIASIIFIFLAAGNYQLLLEMLLPILLFLYSAVLFSVLILRIKKPELKRYFKVPFGRVGPVIIILFFTSLLSIWLRISENALHIIRNGFLFIALGIPVYFLLEMYYNPRAVRKTNNILAYLALFTERLALPLSIRKEILRLIGNVKGKAIFEFGCSVGTMTLHLAEVVGKKGKIYATDISERDLVIAQNRMNKAGHGHVKIMHDLKHHSRIHPDIPDIHLIVSVGMLGYLQNVNHVLRQMNKKLKKGSKVCFVDYDKFFDLIPNKDWLSDDKKIKKLFYECGFKIDVKRKQGFAWKYIFIYGKKFKNIR